MAEWLSPIDLTGVIRATSRVVRCIVVCVVTAVVLWCDTAYAQALRLPGTTEPGQTEKRFEPPALPKREIPPLQIPSDDVVVPEDAAQVVFILNAVSLQGNTVYRGEELQVIWESSIGAQVSLADLYALAAAITLRYRSDGYVLSRAVVPAQRIVDGVATIRIVEGYIDRVIIEGKIGGAEYILEQYAQKLTAVRPLTATALERYLLLIRDLPGVSLQSVLQPAAKQPGAADLTIVLDHAPVQFTGEINNRGNDFIGPIQALAGMSLNSPLGLYEQVNVHVATTPASFKELVYMDANFSRVVGDEGTQFSVATRFSWSEPEARGVLKTLGVENQSAGFELTLTHPVLRSRAQSVWLAGSFFFQNNSTDLFQGRTVLTRDRIRAVRLDGIYDRLDRWGALNRLGIGLSQGVNVLDASESGSVNLSRSNGKSDYTLLRGDFLRLQPIGQGWSALLGVSGQYAFDPLLASREFGIGGPQFVRAYDPSEKLGDSGLALKTELQFGQNPEWRWLRAYQVYAYYDFGAVWNRSDPPGTDSNDSIDATGIGVRTTLLNHLSAYVEMAKPLAGGVSARGGDPNAPRVFFAATAVF